MPKYRQLTLDESNARFLATMQETRDRIADLENRIVELTSTMGQLKSLSGDERRNAIRDIQRTDFEINKAHKALAFRRKEQEREEALLKQMQDIGMLNPKRGSTALYATIALGVLVLIGRKIP